MNGLTNGTVNQDMVAERKANFGEPIPTPTFETPTPSNRDIRNIQIDPLDRGFVVRVGCQTFAIEDKGVLIAKFIEYINNPIATEQKYKEGKLF